MLYKLLLDYMLMIQRGFWLPLAISTPHFGVPVASAPPLTPDFLNFGRDVIFGEGVLPKVPLVTWLLGVSHHLRETQWVCPAVNIHLSPLVPYLAFFSVLRTVVFADSRLVHEANVIR